jgi:hypothetical protein
LVIISVLGKTKEIRSISNENSVVFEIHPSVSKLTDNVMYLLHMLLQMILPAKSVTTSPGTTIEPALEGPDPGMTGPLVSVKFILSGIRMPASKRVANEAVLPGSVSDNDPQEDGKNLHSTSSSL